MLPNANIIKKVHHFNNRTCILRDHEAITPPLASLDPLNNNIMSSHITPLTAKRTSNKFSGQFKTFYMKEFTPKSPVANNYFNCNLYNHKKSDFPMLLHTTHNSEYKNFGQIKTNSCKKESKIPDELFTGSSYSNVIILDRAHI